MYYFRSNFVKLDSHRNLSDVKTTLGVVLVWGVVSCTVRMKHDLESPLGTDLCV